MGRSYKKCLLVYLKPSNNRVCILVLLSEEWLRKCTQMAATGERTAHHFWRRMFTFIKTFHRLWRNCKKHWKNIPVLGAELYLRFGSILNLINLIKYNLDEIARNLTLILLWILDYFFCIFYRFFNTCHNFIAYSLINWLFFN